MTRLSLVTTTSMWGLALRTHRPTFSPLHSNFHGINAGSSIKSIITQRQRWQLFSTGSSSDNDEISFQPTFDGQLFYGLEADNKGKVDLSLHQLRQMASSKSTDSNMADKEPLPFKTDSNPKSLEAIAMDQRQRTTIRKVPVISRTIPLGIPSNRTLSVTIWEMEQPSDIVELWMTGSPNDKDKMGDPFGVVMWPGSILAAREMARIDLRGETVLVLGAGTGVEAQVAAHFGAKRVVATDINRFTLALLDYGAERAGFGDVIEGMVFDIFSKEKLPPCDVIIASDILYNEKLAKQVGRRCLEALKLNPKPTLIVTDSQRFHGTDFLQQISGEVEEDLSWEDMVLKNVTGSGILIREDQTYDVKARILRVT